MKSAQYLGVDDLYINMMKTNNLKNKSNPRSQITKNKDLFQSQQLSEQLWASNRQSHNVSLSNVIQKSSSRFDIPTLLQIFTEHYVHVEQCFHLISGQLTKFESKLAQCFGRFNEIEWKLNREIHQVTEAKSLNNSLMRINKQIEDKLALVKNDYQQLKKRRYVSSMQSKIQELQEMVHKMELQSYRSKFNKQDMNQFEDNLDRLEKIVSKSSFNHDKTGKVEILSQIIEDLIKFLRLQGNISEWIEAKVHENISLKFQIMKIDASRQ